MKTAIFLLGGVLVATTLFMSEAASIYRYDGAQQYDSAYEDLQDLLSNDTKNCTNGVDCYFYPWPYPVYYACFLYAKMVDLQLFCMPRQSKQSN